MKKIILFTSVSILLALGVWKGYQTLQTPKIIQEKQISSVSGEKTIPLVTLTLVDGEGISTYSGILATTPFDALQKVSTDNQIPLKTKQYDFGIFVEEIGNRPSVTDRAWIYFVNGVSGDVGADKKTLKTGDLVEWRYMKPIF